MDNAVNRLLSRILLLNFVTLPHPSKNLKRTVLRGFREIAIKQNNVILNEVKNLMES